MPRPRSGGRQWICIRGVEGLYARLVVAIEGCHRAVWPEAEVITGRVGEPGADLIQVDADPLTVDERGRECLRHDQPEGVVGEAQLVGREVANVLGGAKGRARQLEEEDGE